MTFPVHLVSQLDQETGLDFESFATGPCTTAAGPNHCHPMDLDLISKFEQEEERMKRSYKRHF